MKIYFLLFILLIVNVSANVEYYYGLDCPHCKVVEESNVLENLNKTVSVTKYETWYNVNNSNKFSSLLDDLSIPKNDRGVPFALINCSGKVTYLVGDQPIIDNLIDYATNCNFEPITQKPSNLANAGFILSLVIIITFVIYKFANRRNHEIQSNKLQVREDKGK